MSASDIGLNMLCTFIYLQGSQTRDIFVYAKISFAPLFTYKVLKRVNEESVTVDSFAPLFTYKVLKPPLNRDFNLNGFAPLFTYKVLKQGAGS